MNTSFVTCAVYANNNQIIHIRFYIADEKPVKHMIDRLKQRLIAVYELCSMTADEVYLDFQPNHDYC